ncbi:MAG: CehA/McbA family metallohydrolase [Labilithrix sp.]|nr:CehA/McbA family metallohydrolase [Labilithrix sp.]
MTLRRLALALGPLALSAALGGSGGCGSPGGGASARVITSRMQLVGGDRALGDVGDYLLENDKLRVVVQQPGFSRGFGVYGGSLIDADLRRPFEIGTSGEPSGNDQFGELFPAFFVQAVNVDRVFIENDGADGRSARLAAQGEAGDFLELAAILNRAVTGSNIDFQSLTSQPRLRYTTVYEAEPGNRWVKITFRVLNVSSRALKFPSELATELLGLASLPTDGFKIPLGDVALFGATSSVWIPGIGFDSRFGLEDSYGRPVDFPAFPGVVAEWVASRGAGTSYGLLVGPSPRNFVLAHRETYDDGTAPIDDTSLLVPFSASSFLGIFHDTAPPALAPGEAFESVKYFVLGSGDVGSVLDGVHALRGARTGELGGQVFDATTGEPAVGASVIVYQKRRGPGGSPYRVFSQYDVREHGSFGGTLEPGVYGVRVQGHGRPLTPITDVEIEEGRTTAIRLTSDPPGRVTVRVVDPDGHPLPAKASAVGVYAAEDAGKLTRTFLFDLQCGEPFRSTDMIDDDPAEGETRRFIEAVAYTDEGTATLEVRPGTYRIVSSRGPEYDLAATDVTVGPDETRSITHVLTRVVDTSGFIAGDMHVHSRNSIDSSMSLDERVRALAAEGVEWAVSTDHNYVTDYRPYVARNDLFQWLYPMVGLEMTTLESGHFNGYPMRYERGPVTHGAFAWAGRPPDDVFADLRALGSLGPNRTFIQVNHPRDGVLGYFSQYQRDPYTAEETPPTLVQQIIAPKGPAFRRADGSSAYSLGYDGIEVANGKLFHEIHHYRVPDALPSGELPADVPAAGKIVRSANGQPAFPGAVEDWFNLLNLGHRFVAVGTADSHSGSDEAGHFRTMVFVGDDRPITLTDERIIDAMRARRVVATNAPLLDFWIDDPVRGVMGQTIRSDAEKVEVHFKLTAAPWVSVARVNVWRNGTIAKVVEIDPERDLARSPALEVFEVELAKDAAGARIDSWFVLEAIGYKSFFPAVKPHEVPPVLLTEAVATLAGPLGLGSDELGALRPPEWFPVTAFAITNPVWVTTTSGAFQPPGVVPVDVLDQPSNDPKMQAFVYPRSTIRPPKMRKLSAVSRSVDRFEPRGKVPLFYPRADNPEDVRKALSRFGHMAGHAE